MTAQHTPSLPSGGDVGALAKGLLRHAEWLHLTYDFGYMNPQIEMLKHAAAALTASEAERESERDARHKLEAALRAKDAAMQVLFDRMKAAGVDYSDLIP